jgi:dimethylargininase
MHGRPAVRGFSERALAIQGKKALVDIAQIEEKNSAFSCARLRSRLLPILIAITRKVSPRMSECELTHLARAPIDVHLAAQQHLAYEQDLEGLGCEVLSLPAEPELADSVFVEDAAVVFDELAILANPGAESRRAEVGSVAAALAPYRRLASIEAPGTLDGGDVLTVGKRVFVGLSRRTNPAGVEQMRTLLAPHGYSVEGVPVERCLHLKSAVSQVGERTLLLNPAWIGSDAFRDFERIEVDAAEPYAANALLVKDAVLYPAAHVRTRKRLEERGVRVIPVEVSELAKAEGGVTCCSLILRK